MKTKRLISRLASAASILSTFLALAGPSQAAVGTLYAVTGAGGGSHCGGSLSTLYTFDPATGAASTIGPVMIDSTQARNITGLAVHPSTGVLYAIMKGVNTSCVDDGKATLLTIDPATGAATIVGTQGGIDVSSFNVQVPDMTFDPFGTLYAWNEFDGDNLWIIDTATGTGSFAQQGDLSTFRTGLASDSRGRLYVKVNSELYRLNQYTGKSFDFVELDAGLANMLAFDQNNVLFSGTRTSEGFELYTINPTSGATTLIGSNTVNNVGAIAFDRGVVTTPPVADLSLSKDIDVPNPVVGTDVVFTLTVTNDGPDETDGVVVSDPLPAGYAYVSSIGDGSYDDATGLWTIGGPIAGTSASASIQITATVLNEPGQFTNIAEVVDSDSYDPDSVPGSGDDSGDTYAHLTPDVLVPKLFSMDRDSNQFWVIVDPTSSFTDRAINLTLDGYDIFGGNGLATQPETGTLFGVFDSFGSRVLATIEPTTGVSTFVGDLGNNRVAAITFGADQNTFYGITGNSGNDPRTLFTINPADGAMTAVCTVPFGYGRAMTFADGLIYTATEVCPNDCFIQIEIIDPSSFPGSAGDPCGGTTVDTDLFYYEPTALTLDSSVGGTVTLLMASFSDLFEVEITGGQASALWLSSMSHNSKGLALSIADVTIGNLSPSKTFTKSRVKGARLIEYTIGAGNEGPDSISNVVLTDNLPAGTTFVSADSGCEELGGTLSCLIGQLDPGVTQFFSFTLEVTCKKCSSITNHVGVGGEGVYYDNPYDNVSSTFTSVKGKF